MLCHLCLIVPGGTDIILPVNGWRHKQEQSMTSVYQTSKNGAGNLVVITELET